MQLLSLRIQGFRGIRDATISFDKHSVIIGPNGSGKSAVIDALSLVLGRQKLVRPLTEHDFFGSRPQPGSRIFLTVTVGGFPGNRPEQNPSWFRASRGIEFWWDREAHRPRVEASKQASELCTQIGLCARFDHEALEVEQIRYFVDSPALDDPFSEDGLALVPQEVLRDVGYYVVPADRTWEALLSFGSELFKRAVTELGRLPAESVLAERDRLRAPESPLEEDDNIQPLIGRINEHLASLLPEPASLRLRLTSGDSDALLRALAPHYERHGSVLPASRHGHGLLSLQAFVLLLETGRIRKDRDLSFILAMEEPELHIPPGLQRRLLGRSAAIADQTICVTHAPRVAAFFPAHHTILLSREGGVVRASRLLDAPLTAAAPNRQRKFYQDLRTQVLDALMNSRVLIPEGRTDFEWLRLLNSALETRELEPTETLAGSPPFGAIVGVVPTPDAAVLETYSALRRLRDGVVILVDGDEAGDAYIAALLQLVAPPRVIVQWPGGQTIEDAILWILNGSWDAVSALISESVPVAFADATELLQLLKTNSSDGGLKTDYLSYETIAGVIRDTAPCLERAHTLAHALCCAVRSEPEEQALLAIDSRSNEETRVIRISL